MVPVTGVTGVPVMDYRRPRMVLCLGVQGWDQASPATSRLGHPGPMRIMYHSVKKDGKSCPKLDLILALGRPKAVRSPCNFSLAWEYLLKLPSHILPLGQHPPGQRISVCG